MNLRKALLLLAVATFVTASANAQFGVYGTFTANHLSGIKSSPLATTPGALNNDVSPLGGTGGIYYDFYKIGHLVKLGVDARGVLTSTKRGAFTNANGGGAHIDSGLFGVRAVFNAPFMHTLLRPYVQGSVGIARSNYGILYGSNGVEEKSSFEYMGYAGLDIPLAPFMDFRLVEVGVGALNNNHTYPLQSVSSGIVFHLPF
jgi:hypothetical protein